MKFRVTKEIMQDCVYLKYINRNAYILGLLCMNIDEAYLEII